MTTTCDTCGKPRERGFLFCREHLTTEIDRWFGDNDWWNEVEGPDNYDDHEGR